MSTRVIRKKLADEIYDCAKRASTKSTFHDDFFVDFKEVGSFREKATEVAYQLFVLEEDNQRLTAREEDQLIINTAKVTVEYFVCIDKDSDNTYMDRASRKEVDNIDEIIRAVETELGCSADELEVESTTSRRTHRRDESPRRDSGRGSRRETTRRDVRDVRSRGESRRDTGRGSRRDRNDHGAGRNRLNVPPVVEEAVQEVRSTVRRSREEEPAQKVGEIIEDHYLFQNDMSDDNPTVFKDFHAPDSEYPFPTVYQNSQLHAVYVVSQNPDTGKIFIKDQDFIEMDTEEGIKMTRIGSLHEGYLVFRRQDSAELEDLQAGMDVINSLIPAKNVLESLTNGDEIAISNDLKSKHRFVTIGTLNDNVELTPVHIRACVPEEVQVEYSKDIVSVMSRQSFEYTVRQDSDAGKILSIASSEGKPNLSGLHLMLNELRPVMDADAWFELNQTITVEVNSLLSYVLGANVLAIDSFYIDWNSLEAHLSEEYGIKMASAISGRGKQITDQLIRYTAITEDESAEPTDDVWLTNASVDLVTSIPIKSNDLDLALAQAGKIGMVSNAVTPRLYTALSSLLDIKDRLTLRNCYIVTRDRVSIEVTRHIMTKSILIKIL